MKRSYSTTDPPKKVAWSESAEVKFDDRDEDIVTEVLTDQLEVATRLRNKKWWWWRQRNLERKLQRHLPEPLLRSEFTLRTFPYIGDPETRRCTDHNLSLEQLNYIQRLRRFRLDKTEVKKRDRSRPKLPRVVKWRNSSGIFYFSHSRPYLYDFVGDRLIEYERSSESILDELLNEN